MTLTEAIEFGMPCVNLTQDAEWCEVALETMKKYQELIPDNATNIGVIKSLFSNGTQVKGAGIFIMDDKRSNLNYDIDWGDAPYRKE